MKRPLSIAAFLLAGAVVNVAVAWGCVSTRTRCGQRIHMDEMIVAPREGIAEDRAAPDHMPWLERGETGAVAAWAPWSCYYVASKLATVEANHESKHTT